MMHWQAIIGIFTIISTTYLIVQDKPWWGIGLLIITFFAISPSNPK